MICNSCSILCCVEYKLVVDRYSDNMHYGVDRH